MSAFDWAARFGHTAIMSFLKNICPGVLRTWRQQELFGRQAVGMGMGKDRGMGMGMGMGRNVERYVVCRRACSSWCGSRCDWCAGVVVVVAAAGTTSSPHIDTCPTPLARIHLHVYTYTYTPTRIHLHVYTYTHTPTRIHLHAYTYTHTHFTHT